jgi:hypothetical protein
LDPALRAIAPHRQVHLTCHTGRDDQQLAGGSGLINRGKAVILEACDLEGKHSARKESQLTIL